jgi:uncharacterized protein
MHFLLFYEYAPDYMERRGPMRPEHLKMALESVDRGELLLAGALADPPDGAVLVFSGESPAAAEAFAVADPYVRNGLVKRWFVRKWTTVVGKDASAPAR